MRRREHEEDWEAKLRFRPTAVAVRRLLASDGHAAVQARWGGRSASELIRSAPDVRRVGKGRPRTRPVEA